MIYHWDRYVDGCLMAEGAVTIAETENQAVVMARELFERGAQPGEMARTEFVLRMTEERRSMTECQKRPRCHDCADSDGWCCNDAGGRNCGFSKGHPLYRAEPFRPNRIADGENVKQEGK